MIELPDGLDIGGTYHRYKLGETQFNNWLKRTVEKLLPDQKAPEPPSVQQRRHAAANAAASSYFGLSPHLDAPPEPPKLKQIHWREIEDLAEKLVRCGDPSHVPAFALTLLREVIRLRKETTEIFGRYSKNTKDQKVIDSNARHRYYLAVLEGVLGKLERFISRGASSSGGTNKAPPTPRGNQNHVAVSDLANMFQYLEVHVADDSGSDSQPEEEKVPERTHDQPKRKGGLKKATKQKKPEKQTQVVAKPRDPWVENFDFGLTPMETDYWDDEFDLYMMIYCFFLDFNAVRNYVAERWCDYWYDRSVSLTTLAVLTNAAFELFDKMHSDLNRSLGDRPGLGKYESMMRLLFFEYGIEHIDYDSYEDLTPEESDERIWRDEADWLAFFSYCTVEFLLANTPISKVPLVPPSKRTPPTYGANDLKSWREFSQNVSLRLAAETIHLKALKRNKEERPILPAEPKHLLEFEMTFFVGVYSTTLIFSLHLWVDIRSIIENDVEKAFEQMQQTASEVEPVLLAHDPANITRDREFKKLFRQRTEEISKYMLGDCQYEDMKLRYQKAKIDEDPEKFSLLKMEPVWAGLLDFRLRLVRSELGHQFTAQTSIVEAAACLYCACFDADPKLPAWATMGNYLGTYTDHSQLKTAIVNCEDTDAMIRSFEQFMTADQVAMKELDNPDSTDRTFIPAIRIRRAFYRRYGMEDPEGRRPSTKYMTELSVQNLQIRRDAKRERMQRQARERLARTRAIEAGNSSTAGNAGATTDNALTKQVKTASLSSKSKEESITAAADRDFKRRAMLSQLSHIGLLELIDKMTTSQLEGILTLDYFKLFDESVAFLKAVLDAFEPDLKERVGYDEANERTTAVLGRLPVHLVKNLDEQLEVESVVATLSKVYKECLEGGKIEVRENSGKERQEDKKCT